MAAAFVLAGPAFPSGAIRVVSVSQLEPFRATLEYSFLPGTRIANLTAESHGTGLPVVSHSAYPHDGAVTAILFLIDTSASRRPATLQQNFHDLKRLVSSARPHHRMGLATFDADLQLRAPIGSAPAELLSGATQISSKGLNTELFRNALAAIHLLGKERAARRALVIFSDGEAEDKAYRLEDVVRAATESRVNVFGLGFTERASQAVQLQNLRRLSEETNGVYVAGGRDQALPEGFLSAPWEALDAGGRIVLDLLPASSPMRSLQRTARISFALDGAQVSVDVAVAVPRRPPTRTEIAGAALLAIGLAAALFAVLRRRSRAAQAERREPIAFLEFLDGAGSTVPMTTTQLTIGRNSQGNKLCLDNDSVSAHHAVIVQRRDGSFEVKEVVSTNGVLVNNRKVAQSSLADGDLIRLGDVQFRFRRHAQGLA